MTAGSFIVIEGIDGAGTTTQTQLLGAWFRRKGMPVHLTREPTQGPIGALIRQALTHRLVLPGMGGPRAPSWSTMALLFAADRLDHLDAEIIPNLRDGISVVSDRYDLSSLAYQSATSTEDDVAAVIQWVRTCNAQALRPDLTLVVDVEPEVAAKRRTARSNSAELYEEGTLQSILADAYAHAESLVPGDRVVHVDGNAAPDAVHAEIVEALLALRGDLRR